MLSRLRRRLAESTPRARLILLLALTALGTTHCAPMTWNDESRMATIQSLVEYGSFVIDRTDFITTGDKVYIDGHFYSDKPPLPSIIGAAVYFPLHLLGLRLHGGNSVAYFLITLCTVALLWLLGTLAFFESLRFTGLDQERRLLASIALGLGTIYLSWSTTFNNHEFAAAFLAIGFLFLLKARFEAAVPRNLAIAGLFLSLAGAVDNPIAIFYTLFLIYVVRDKHLRGYAVFFLMPLVVTIIPELAINYSIHHSIMPVQIYRSYFEYPGSPWIGSNELSGMHTNDVLFTVTYAFLTLFGPKGFLLYNPFLIIGLWGLARTIAGRGRFFWEGVCVAAGSMATAVYYWLTTNNYAGWSYSIRWFVPLIPLVMFFFHPFLEILNTTRKRQFQMLLGISLILAFVGALNPWSPVIYSEVSFLANIEQFIVHLHRPAGIRPTY